MSDDPDKTINYLRFIAFFIDVATETVLKVFNYLIQAYKDTTEFLTLPKVKKKITLLRKRKVINEKHYNLLNAYVLDASKFDISLLITLIINTCSDISSYSSISADIDRIRDLRNSIIAHKPRAVLYKEKFEKLWNELENILRRLNNLVAPETTAVLSRNIEKYRTRSFSDQDDRNYKQMFEESCEEISRLQKEMEELSQKCNEFTIFFRKTPEKYFQYIQLLFEGGKFVLISVLSKGLADNKLDLRTILFYKQKDLERNTNSRELLCQIYTNDEAEINTDISTWDIIVLAEVIEVSLNLKERQIKKVRIIKDARKNYADSALKAIANTDLQHFFGCCEDLVSSIEVLSSMLDEDLQTKCDEHISRYKAPLTDNEVSNCDDYLSQLKAKGMDIKNLSELHKETVDKLKQCVKQMSQSGIHFNNQYVLHLKMIVLGGNKEKEQEAEDALQTVMDASLAKSDILPELAAPRHETDKIFEVLQAIPNVKIGEIKRECIILSIECFSCQTLLNVIDYLTGELFKENLLSLAMELSFICDDVIAIEGNLTFECLNDMFTNFLKDNESANAEPDLDAITLPVVCFSPAGMQSVLKFVKTESFTNSINVIADGLSSYVEETISLKVIPDCKELYGILEETDSETASSSDSREEEIDFSDRFLPTKLTGKECVSLNYSTNLNETTPELFTDEVLSFDEILTDESRDEYSENNTNEDKETLLETYSHIEDKDLERLTKWTWKSEVKNTCLSSGFSEEQAETVTDISLKKVNKDESLKYVDIMCKSAFKKNIINHYGFKYAATSHSVGVVLEDVKFAKLYVQPFPLYDITPNEEKEVYTLSDVFYNGTTICKNIFITSETGMGKTAFMKWITLCWCKVQCKDENEVFDFLPKENVMSKFDFLFYIHVENVTLEEYNIEHMIYNSIVNLLPEPIMLGKDFLKTILESENCLVIMDGIDESLSDYSRMLPEMINRTSSSYVITCTRHTFERLKTSSIRVEKHLQIRAFESEKSKKLSINILSVASDINEESNGKFAAVIPPRLSFGINAAWMEFDRMLKKKKISHLKCFPVSLIHILSLWFEGKLDQSKCEIYSGIVIAMIKRASLKKLFSKQLLKFKTDEPHTKEECIENSKPYHSLLMQLSRLAYFTIRRFPDEPCLRFGEDDAIQILSTDMSFSPQDIIEIGLNTGILCVHSQTEYLRKETCLSFFQRSVHDFFAALYISCNISTLEEVKSACQSVSSFLEYANVFMFICGLNDTSSQDILEHVLQEVYTDEIFSKYRDTVNSERIPEIKFVQDIVIECIKERRDSGRGHLYLPLEDAVLDSSCKNQSYRKILKRMLTDNNIKSLSIEEYGSKEDERQRYSVFKCLELSSVLKLRIEGHLNYNLQMSRSFTSLQYVHLKGYALAKRCTEWDGVIYLIHLPTIKAIALEDFYATHKNANEILNMLSGKRNLTQIVLRVYKCLTHQKATCELQLNLTNHKELNALEIYGVPAINVQVNMERLEDFKIGSLGDSSASLFFQGLKETSKLNSITCIDIVRKDDIKQMILALSKLKNLTCLDMSFINLDEEIIRLSPEMKSLNKIKLSFVTISVDALQNLLECLKKYKQTISTEIVYCSVRSETFENHAI